MNKILGVLFILTGIFAIAGGFYTWGGGVIFSQNELVKVLIPWADIIFTGPLSLICGFGILRKKDWSELLSLSLSGIYIFGSILVFISILWNKDYSIFLIIPSISGFLIGLGYMVLTIKRRLYVS